MSFRFQVSSFEFQVSGFKFELVDFLEQYKMERLASGNEWDLPAKNNLGRGQGQLVGT